MSMMSARAKQQAYRKDRIFQGAQKHWVDRFLETTRLCSERLYRQRCVEILVHIKAPRSLLLTLGQDIPVAGGATGSPPVTAPEEMLGRIKRLLYESKQCFGGDDVLLLKLRELSSYCGATRDDLVNIMHDPPPDF